MYPCKPLLWNKELKPNNKMASFYKFITCFDIYLTRLNGASIESFFFNLLDYISRRILILEIQKEFTVPPRNGKQSLSIGGFRGACLAHALQGSRFSGFNIQNFQNVTASGVHAPPTRSTPSYGKSWIRHCLGGWESTRRWSKQFLLQTIKLH